MDLRRRIAMLRRSLMAATAAPWIVEHIELDEQGIATIERQPSWRSNPWHTTVGWQAADRELVQHAVRELPALLDVLESQQAALDELHARLQGSVIEVGSLERCREILHGWASRSPPVRSRRRTG